MNQLAVVRSLSFSLHRDMVRIPIVSQSCVYGCRSKESPQGTIYEHEIGFRIAGLNTATCDLVAQLRKTDTLYLDDVNGLRHTVSRGTLRFKFSIDRVVAGTFGSFRGYDINIKLSSLAPAAVSPF